MQELTVPVGSVQYLYAAPLLPAQESATDPTAGTVHFALLTAGTDPAAGDFVAGEWFTDGNGKLWARILLGDTIPLSQGIFNAWIRTDLDSEELERCFARVYVS